MGYSKSIYFNDEEGMTNESVARKKTNKHNIMANYISSRLQLVASSFAIDDDAVFSDENDFFFASSLSTPHTIADCLCTYACTNFFQYAIKTCMIQEER
jgi:hypothetical protein